VCRDFVASPIRRGWHAQRVVRWACCHPCREHAHATAAWACHPRHKHEVRPSNTPGQSTEEWHGHPMSGDRAEPGADFLHGHATAPAAAGRLWPCHPAALNLPPTQN
jgi:hypothetical protein